MSKSVAYSCPTTWKGHSLQGDKEFGDFAGGKYTGNYGKSYFFNIFTPAFGHVPQAASLRKALY